MEWSKYDRMLIPGFLYISILIYFPHFSMLLKCFIIKMFENIHVSPCLFPQILLRSDGDMWQRRFQICFTRKEITEVAFKSFILKGKATVCCICIFVFKIKSVSEWSFYTLLFSGIFQIIFSKEEKLLKKN